MKKSLIITAILTVLLYSVASAPVFAAVNCKTNSPISLTNYTNGTTIRYPVPLIRGALTDVDANSVTIVNTSSNRSTRQMQGLARKGNFKVLTELVPGSNKLLIRQGNYELPLTLNYKPQTNPYIVRVVYLTDKTGNTEYQSPIENDPQDYKSKLGTAMKLMQTFTAERMNDLGFGRVTFNLEFEEDGSVKVHTLAAEENAEHYHKIEGLYHKIEGLKLWNYTNRLISRKLPRSRAKNLAIPAFTRFDPKTKKTYAHTALGGGSLALFGGANIFTWPSSLNDAQKIFMDTRMIDTSKFFSDSVGKKTFWATASTTIGAALHEMGHTFGLPHSNSRHDIMTRGFDRFNRAFTLIEPPHASRRESYEFDDSETARWDPPSAAWLKFSRWFALDEKDFGRENKTSVKLDRQSRKILVESESGIGGIVLGEKDRAKASVPIDYSKAPPRRVEISLDEFGEHLRGDRAAVRVIDTQGLTRTVTMSELRPGSFVESWRFASITAPWTDSKSFVSVDEKRLQAIVDSAASAELSVSQGPYIDFLDHFTDGPRENVAAYVVKTFTSNKARDVRIFTGSDDALRVWLNGKLVTSVLALRGAGMDQESNAAKLRAGENTIIAEVSQWTGGWGLFLRIADEKGGDLILSDDGKIGTSSPAVPQASRR